MGSSRKNGAGDIFWPALIWRKLAGLTRVKKKSRRENLWGSLQQLCYSNTYYYRVTVASYLTVALEQQMHEKPEHIFSNRSSNGGKGERESSSKEIRYKNKWARSMNACIVGEWVSERASDKAVAPSLLAWASCCTVARFNRLETVRIHVGLWEDDFFSPWSVGERGYYKSSWISTSFSRLHCSSSKPFLFFFSFINFAISYLRGEWDALLLVNPSTGRISLDRGGQDQKEKKSCFQRRRGSIRSAIAYELVIIFVVGNTIS